MATDTKTQTEDFLGEINKYDFREDEYFVFKARKGLDRKIVEEISEMKREPAWMRDFRLKSLDIFNSKPMPPLGRAYRHQFPGCLLLSQADRRNQSKIVGKTSPAEIKHTFDRLGIPNCEKKHLAGVKAQYESEVVYGSFREDLANRALYSPTPIPR